MKRRDAAPGLSRRDFLGLASAAVGLWVPRAWAGPPGQRAGGGRSPASSRDRDHVPILHVPGYTANGAKVPVSVEMTHPMTPDHHVTRIEVVNASDPIPSKGTFLFTPRAGRVHVAFQARMHDGPSEVSVTSECNRHGKSTASRRIEIPAGAGGCTGTAPAALVRASGDDVRAPVIRIPALVARGRIERGEIILAQVKMKHPSRTGLALRDGQFVQESEPFYLEEMEVSYAGERVCTFEMTPALSDDPFITFSVLADREGPIGVHLKNNRGQEFEATHEIRFS